jgi:hypothetical protein
MLNYQRVTELIPIINGMMFPSTNGTCPPGLEELIHTVQDVQVKEEMG